MNVGTSLLQTSVPSVGANTSPHPMNAQQPQNSAWVWCVQTGQNIPAHAYLQQMATAQLFHPLPIAQHKDWLDDEDRKAYMEATVEQDIAWQIASNRRSRKMSQRDLAKAIGTTQSGVARLEDATYGKHSIKTLVKVAHAFECALRVTLISYSKLAVEVSDTSDGALYAAPFSDERYLIEK